MNVFLSKCKRIFPLMLCFVCMNLMILNGSIAQTSGSGSTSGDNTSNPSSPDPSPPSDPSETPVQNTPRPRPKPMVVNPPSTSSGDEICAEVFTTSTVLPIYLENNNNNPVTISNVSLDIDGIFSYSAPTISIGANGEGVINVTFSGGSNISSVFGNQDFVTSISFDVTHNFVGGLTLPTENETTLASYCVEAPQTIDGGGRTRGGAQSTIGVNRLSNLEMGNVDAKPNPTTGNLNISLEIPEDDMNLSLTMYNTLGQEVKSLGMGITCEKGNYTDNYSIEELEKGMYYILIQLNGQTKTIPIVKL